MNGSVGSNEAEKLNVAYSYINYLKHDMLKNKICLILVSNCCYTKNIVFLNQKDIITYLKYFIRAYIFVYYPWFAMVRRQDEDGSH